MPACVCASEGDAASVCSLSALSCFSNLQAFNQSQALTNFDALQVQNVVRAPSRSFNAFAFAWYSDCLPSSARALLPRARRVTRAVIRVTDHISDNNYALALADVPPEGSLNGHKLARPRHTHVHQIEKVAVECSLMTRAAMELKAHANACACVVTDLFYLNVLATLVAQPPFLHCSLSPLSLPSTVPPPRPPPSLFLLSRARRSAWRRRLAAALSPLPRANARWSSTPTP
eukprot:6204203-Pleurochrysis_carterae.AAC.1